MNLFLTLAFLFFIGSVTGWIIELFFRRFLSSANPERKWINPGFCTGPYLPLYGAGLCVLFLVASLDQFSVIENSILEKVVIVIVMGICMTLIEYITGLIALKAFHMRLWDYSGAKFNINGLICPKFSLIWSVLGAAYYFFIHPHILDALIWLSQNLAFSFFIGLFFGVFIIDVIHSAQIVDKIKKFAKENEVIVKYENLKSYIRSIQEKNKEKVHFLTPFRSEHPLSEHLKELADKFEKIKKKRKAKQK